MTPRPRLLAAPLVLMLLSSPLPACYGYQLAREEMASSGEEDADSAGDGLSSGGGTDSGPGTSGAAQESGESAHPEDAGQGEASTLEGSGGGGSGPGEDSNEASSETDGGLEGSEATADGGEDGGESETSEAGSDDSDDADPACCHDQGYWRQYHADASSPKKRRPWPIPEDSLLCDSTWFDLIWSPGQGLVWRELAQAWIVASLNVARGADGQLISDDLKRARVHLEGCQVQDDDEALARELLTALHGFSVDPETSCYAGGVALQR